MIAITVVRGIIFVSSFGNAGRETFDLIPYRNGWLGVDKSAARSGSSSLRPLADLRFRTERIDGHEVVVARKGGKRILLGE